MFHDDRVWNVRTVESAESVARLVTERTWPACTAFAVGDYLFLNDSLPEDGSTDFAVVKRTRAPGTGFKQVASITLGCCSYPEALDHIRRVLSGQDDALDSVFAVEPQLETAAEHTRCPFCS